MVLAISVSFVACGAKAPTSAKNSTTKATAKNSVKTSKATTIAPVNAKMTYTKEVNYIPSYTGVPLTKYTAPSKKQPFAVLYYTIKNTKDNKVYQDYQTILKKDGWTITQAKKSNSISAKKGKYIANIIIQPLDKDVMLMILSK